MYYPKLYFMLQTGRKGRKHRLSYSVIISTQRRRLERTQEECVGSQNMCRSCIWWLWSVYCWERTLLTGKVYHVIDFVRFVECTKDKSDFQDSALHCYYIVPFWVSVTLELCLVLWGQVYHWNKQTNKQTNKNTLGLLAIITNMKATFVMHDLHCNNNIKY